MRMAMFAGLGLAVLGWLLGGPAAAQTTQPAGEQPAPAGRDAAADVEPDTPSRPPPTAAKGTGTPQGDQPPRGTGRPGTFWQKNGMFLVIGGVLLLFLFWMSRGRKKQEQKRREMLSSLRKGDKVTTIGGIIGTIVDVKGKEVTLKVDESANVRMRFTIGAVHRVGDAGKEGDESKDSARK